MRAHLAVVIETLFVLAGGAFAISFPRWGDNWFNRVDRAGRKLAQKRGLAVLTVGCLALAARAALLPIEPIPPARIHDEFSYLLAADTFAHGRLTNPTHPMWPHFESFHILQKPTYMSMFYPAQGLVMAAGQVVANHPFWGVWFSVGLMCAALCWMLQGWMPAEWAFLGGLLSIFRLALFSYWGSGNGVPFSYWDNSYWGGAVAAAGGALVLGALPRLTRRPRIRHGLLLGLGLAVLATSRPYEGIFLALGVAVAISLRLGSKNRLCLNTLVTRVGIPVALVITPTLFAMGYYFWRVTGSPFHSPYLILTKTYNPVPYFPWQSPNVVPHYRHREMKEFYVDWAMNAFQVDREHPIQSAFDKVARLGSFYLGPLLLMPLVALALARRDQFLRGLFKPGKARLLLLLCVPPLVGMALPVYFNPHYAAPLTGALFGLVLMAMRHLRLWSWRGLPVGRQMVRVVPALAVVISVFYVSGAGRLFGLLPANGDFGRSAILAQLRRNGGRQLVVVHYSPRHSPLNEWVYNDADIDAAKVVWARDMGAAGNEELLRYFKDRQVWLLEADDTPPRLLPYGVLQGTLPGHPRGNGTSSRGSERPPSQASNARTGPRRSGSPAVALPRRLDHPADVDVN